MSAGQVWLGTDGLRWVEVQAEAVEPSGWRLMVPLVDPAEAPEAPPLVITVAGSRARVHLLASAPANQLGEPSGELGPDDVERLQQAVRALVAGQ